MPTWTGTTTFFVKGFVINIDSTISTDLHVTDQAHQPRAVKDPGEPTAVERAIHELTHLPCRQWCTTCVRAKGRQDQHQRQKIKQPTIQIDFAFLNDERGNSVVMLSSYDIISGLGGAAIAHSKEYPIYAVTEIKTFV